MVMPFQTQQNKYYNLFKRELASAMHNPKELPKVIRKMVFSVLLPQLMFTTAQAGLSGVFHEDNEDR